MRTKIQLIKNENAYENVKKAFPQYFSKEKQTFKLGIIYDNVELYQSPAKIAKNCVSLIHEDLFHENFAKVEKFLDETKVKAVIYICNSPADNCDYAEVSTVHGLFKDVDLSFNISPKGMHFYNVSVFLTALKCDSLKIPIKCIRSNNPEKILEAIYDFYAFNYVIDKEF